MKSLLVWGLLCAACRGDTVLQKKMANSSPGRMTQYPHTVGLEVNNGQHICAASILSEVWALTSAHCVERKHNVKLRAGTDAREHGGTLHDVSEVVIHPRRNNSTADFDVAVLKVSNPFVFGPKVQKGILPLLGYKAPAGAEAYFAGWSRAGTDDSSSKSLLDSAMKIVDREACRKVWRVKQAITDTMICAAVSEGRGTSCFADSGGPLMVRGRVVGVASWLAGPCANPNYPDVFVNVAFVRPWITLHANV